MAKKRSKRKPYSASKRIFLEGGIAGFFAGLSVITGLSLDPSDLTVSILSHVCQEINGQFHCASIIAGASLLFLGLSLYVVVREIRRLKKPLLFTKWKITPWIEGLIIYLIGIGIVFSLLIIIFL